MKKIIKYGCYTLLVAFASCTTEVITQEEANRRMEIESKEIENSLDVITLDGCEYYHRGYANNYKGKLTHKGNCKNPIHKCNCN